MNKVDNQINQRRDITVINTDIHCHTDHGKCMNKVIEIKAGHYRNQYSLYAGPVMQETRKPNNTNPKVCQNDDIS